VFLNFSSKIYQNKENLSLYKISHNVLFPERQNFVYDFFYLKSCSKLQNLKEIQTNLFKKNASKFYFKKIKNNPNFRKNANCII